MAKKRVKKKKAKSREKTKGKVGKQIKQKAKKTATDVLRAGLSGVIGLIIFLALWGLINLLGIWVESTIFQDIIAFINVNVVLIIIFLIIFIITAILSDLNYPYNLASPLLSGLNAVILIQFVFNLWEFIVLQMNFDTTGIPVNMIQTIISLVVFLLFVFIGYIVIFSRRKKVKDEKTKH